MSDLKHMKEWQHKVLQVNGERLTVWPNKMKLERVNRYHIFLVDFEDKDVYHDSLQQTILERESDPRYGLSLFKGACGVKVHHVDRWNSPAAYLVHQRALAMFCAISAIEECFCDMSWANVYRNGDYCLPHSHTRTEASLVYLLNEGNHDETNPLGGCLSFADPRMPSCCNEEQGRVTSAFLPEMKPGSMIMFPSALMHYVSPYTGDSPRITLSWNISAKKIPGSPNPELDKQREKPMA